MRSLTTARLAAVDDPNSRSAAIFAVQATVDLRQGSGGDEFRAEFNVEWVMPPLIPGNFTLSGVRDDESESMRHELLSGANRGVGASSIEDTQP